MGRSVSEQLLRIISPGYESRRRRARKAARVREERRRSQMRSANDAPSIFGPSLDKQPEPVPAVVAVVPQVPESKVDHYSIAVLDGKRRWESDWNKSVFGFYIALDSNAPGGYVALPPGPRPMNGPKVIERYAPVRDGGWRIDPLQNR